MKKHILNKETKLFKDILDKTMIEDIQIVANSMMLCEWERLDLEWYVRENTFISRRIEDDDFELILFHAWEDYKKKIQFKELSQYYIKKFNPKHC